MPPPACQQGNSSIDDSVTLDKSDTNSTKLGGAVMTAVKAQDTRDSSSILRKNPQTRIHMAGCEWTNPIPHTVSSLLQAGDPGYSLDLVFSSLRCSLAHCSVCSNDVFPRSVDAEFDLLQFGNFLCIFSGWRIDSRELTRLKDCPFSDVDHLIPECTAWHSRK